MLASAIRSNEAADAEAKLATLQACFHPRTQHQLLPNVIELCNGKLFEISIQTMNH
jgi:hypothetical protein